MCFASATSRNHKTTKPISFRRTRKPHPGITCCVKESLLVKECLRERNQTFAAKEDCCSGKSREAEPRREWTKMEQRPQIIMGMGPSPLLSSSLTLHWPHGWHRITAPGRPGRRRERRRGSLQATTANHIPRAQMGLSALSALPASSR